MYFEKIAILTAFLKKKFENLIKYENGDVNCYFGFNETLNYSWIKGRGDQPPKNFIPRLY